MLFYLGLYLLCTLLFMLSDKSKNKLLNPFNLMGIFILAFFAGIRYGIGTDYFFTYLPQYNAITNGTLYVNMEPGFLFLYQVIILFRLGFNFFLFIVSLLTIVFMNVGLRRMTKSYTWIYMLVFMLLYYQVTYNLVRQMLAVSIVVLAVSYFDDKKKFFMLILFATLVHYTSLIAISFPLLHRIVNSKKYNWIKYVVLIVAITLVLNIGLIYDLFYNNSFLRYYSRYLKVGNLNLTIGYYVRTFPVLVMALIYKKTLLSNPKAKFYLFLYLLGCVVKLLAYMSDNQIERISYFFLIFQIPLMSLLIINQRGVRRQFSVFFILTYILVLWYYDFALNNIHQTIPYQWIF